MHEWTWAVIYEDGSIHYEADLGGFGAVEIERVTHLIVMAHQGTAQYVVAILDGMRPIFFRRGREIQINDLESPIPAPYLGPDGSLVRTEYTFATVFGWQKTVNGRNVRSLTWLLYDGSVAVTDRDLDEL